MKDTAERKVTRAEVEALLAKLNAHKDQLCRPGWELIALRVGELDWRRLQALARSNGQTSIGKFRGVEIRQKGARHGISRVMAPIPNYRLQAK